MENIYLFYSVQLFWIPYRNNIWNLYNRIMAMQTKLSIWSIFTESMVWELLLY